MRTSMLILVAVAATVLVTACGSSATGLTGTNWQLAAITEEVPAYQGVVPASEQSRFTITFSDDDTFDATADCNRAAGTYRTTGSDGLAIEVGSSTLVACPDGSYSDLYLHALGQAASYVVTDDRLTITLRDGGTLTFVGGGSPPAVTVTPAPTASPSPKTTAKPTANATPSPSPRATASPTTKPTAGPTLKPTAAPTTAPTAKPTVAPTPPPAGGLTGRTWQLTAITLQDPAFQGVVPPADQAKYTITFATDGTFAAQADCNTVGGTYTTTSSGGLTITPGPSTIVACAEDSYSDLYVLGLTNAANYAIAGDQLTITLQDGGTLVYQ
jgi:heat shock protein HslJ